MDDPIPDTCNQCLGLTFCRGCRDCKFKFCNPCKDAGYLYGVHCICPYSGDEYISDRVRVNNAKPDLSPMEISSLAPSPIEISGIFRSSASPVVQGNTPTKATQESDGIPREGERTNKALDSALEYIRKLEGQHKMYQGAIHVLATKRDARAEERDELQREIDKTSGIVSSMEQFKIVLLHKLQQSENENTSFRKERETLHERLAACKRIESDWAQE